MATGGRELGISSEFHKVNVWKRVFQSCVRVCTVDLYLKKILWESLLDSSNSLQLKLKCHIWMMACATLGLQGVHKVTESAHTHIHTKQASHFPATSLSTHGFTVKLRKSLVERQTVKEEKWEIGRGKRWKWVKQKIKRAVCKSSLEFSAAMQHGVFPCCDFCLHYDMYLMAIEHHGCSQFIRNLTLLINSSNKKRAPFHYLATRGAL